MLLPMTDDEPTAIAPEMRRCAVCGVPLEPAEVSFCAAHRRHEGERARPARHHLTEMLLLGFFLLAAMVAVLLIFM
jgi:predicted nucleic acid-binding Zn ribbon protein